MCCMWDPMSKPHLQKLLKDLVWLFRGIEFQEIQIYVVHRKILMRTYYRMNRGKKIHSNQLTWILTNNTWREGSNFQKLRAKQFFINYTIQSNWPMIIWEKKQKILKFEFLEILLPRKKQNETSISKRIETLSIFVLELASYWQEVVYGSIPHIEEII